MKKTESFEGEIKKYGNSFVIVVPPYVMKISRQFSEGELVKVRLTEV